MNDDKCDLLSLDLVVAEELRSNRLDPELAEQRASQAAALADPTRLMLADALDQAEELCVCDLSWIAERSDNLVSHHLRRLRTDGLVVSRRDGKMVVYSLTETGRTLVRAMLSPSPTTHNLLTGASR